MNYNEKKSLYESIMQDVAKTVKRRLNEAGVPEIKLTNYEKAFQADVQIIKNHLNVIDESKINSVIRILNSLSGNSFYDLTEIDGDRLFYISKVFENLMNNNGTIEQMQSFMNNMSKTEKQVGSAIYR